MQNVASGRLDSADYQLWMSWKQVFDLAFAHYPNGG